ncbi:hypothetical protein [Pelosinus baikalensis]|uniref:Uncharacterized protein n=1 Tax=Pelosinus baikalensis TaxID=2892015 RepID=A0ABS8I0X1_9FIRM|nr:hypothetical protein [Pelosinus baikalensis]MCC5468626.1 hypothetical protein [Pelosinus baikalensis]
MKMKTVVLCLLITLSASVCNAKNVVHQIEDSMPVDKWAHLGLGYIINDQLKRHTHLTPLERVLVVSGVAYAKEKWADEKFDSGDLAVTVAGSLFCEIKF